jgi:hypothetical protein
MSLIEQLVQCLLHRMTPCRRLLCEVESRLCRRSPLHGCRFRFTDQTLISVRGMTFKLIPLGAEQVEQEKLLKQQEFKEQKRQSYLESRERLRKQLERRKQQREEVSNLLEMMMIC